MVLMYSDMHEIKIASIEVMRVGERLWQKRVFDKLFIITSVLLQQHFGFVGEWCNFKPDTFLIRAFVCDKVSLNVIFSFDLRER